MQNHMTDYDALVREARILRARAIYDLWNQLVERVSPRVPKLFPAQF